MGGVQGVSREEVQGVSRGYPGRGCPVLTRPIIITFLHSLVNHSTLAHANFCRLAQLGFFASICRQKRDCEDTNDFHKVFPNN